MSTRVNHCYKNNSTRFYTTFQVKKIARRQNQDNGKGKKDGENGEKGKSKSPNSKKDDDSESDSSFTGNDNALTGTV